MASRLGAVIDRYLAATGHNASQLAGHVGVHKSMITRWHSGERIPTWLHAVRIVRAMSGIVSEQEILRAIFLDTESGMARANIEGEVNIPHESGQGAPRDDEPGGHTNQP